ncbi:hypothetical protein FNF29_07661 [Cafeteria roenbergensis]|uniref:Uncharacterized protein n=1 Tax=Cafeteria roenbergensis TaxID=33653 RepID=A0A5A8C2T3_CAFRO|nr:hypothetical protein FNF29_07661 [Cafeteria roenbergensis]|eukprot:KAA0147034.1 hypothetical protein FNF29_07661 [Cafeteria roenbergensis]
MWGTPPLHLAAFSGHADAVALLLGAGARVNAKDYARMTPLHRAVAAGQSEVVALLLRNGAKVNRRCKEGRSPLHVAAADHRKAGLARMLLDEGADEWLGDKEGTTPLRLAEVSGNEALQRPWLRRRGLFLWRRAIE